MIMENLAHQVSLRPSALSYEGGDIWGEAATREHELERSRGVEYDGDA